jgi:hypothetical protein
MSNDAAGPPLVVSAYSVSEISSFTVGKRHGVPSEAQYASAFE